MCSYFIFLFFSWFTFHVYSYWCVLFPPGHDPHPWMGSTQKRSGVLWASDPSLFHSPARQVSWQTGKFWWILTSRCDKQINKFVGALLEYLKLSEMTLCQGALLEKMLISQGKEQVWHLIRFACHQIWEIPLARPKICGNFMKLPVPWISFVAQWQLWPRASRRSSQWKR